MAGWVGGEAKTKDIENMTLELNKSMKLFNDESKLWSGRMEKLTTVMVVVAIIQLIIMFLQLFSM